MNFTDKQRDFLKVLESNGGAIGKTMTQTGANRNTVYAWRRRNSDFGAEVTRIQQRKGPAPPPVDGEVPDFLTWRERHCAYLINDGDDNMVAHRAENFWFQFKVVEGIESKENVIFVLPPGHLKTTLVGIEYLTWRIQRNRNFRGMVIRANAAAAGDNSAAIAQRLSDHDYYRNLAEALVAQGKEPIVNPIEAYGGKGGYQPQTRKIGERWSGGEFTVSGRSSGEKDATITAIGMDGAIPGFRADCIVIDDPQDPTKYDASGAANSDKLMRKFERDIAGRLLPGGKTIILANRLGPDDFVGQLIDRYEDDPDWAIIYFPAVIERYGRAEPLCPEIFTLDDLAKRRRKVGESAWAFHYMQEPIDERIATFTQNQMDSCKAYDRTLGDDPPKATFRVLGVDPAVSGFCAMIVWGVDPSSGMRYLIDFVNEEGMRTEDNIAYRTVAEAEAYRCQVIVVEVRNIQASIFEKVRDMCRGKNIKVVAYKTATSTGAQAEETDFSITTIGKLMDDRMVSLPFANHDQHTQVQMQTFITQFLRWKPRPPGKSSWHLVRDLVMAALFAESEARKAVKDANRPERKTRVRDVPRWATNKGGGWAWKRTG